MTIWRLFDDALDQALFLKIQNSVIHHTDLESLYRNSFWFPIDGTPRLNIEHAIIKLRHLLPTASSPAGAEWWIPALKPSQGMEWHCDCDRIVYERDKRFVRPQFSSVLYLGDIGGWTIIVDDVVTDSLRRRPQREKGGVGYSPVPNRYGIFPGDRLHAVAISSGDNMRVTIAINWWTEKPSAPLCIAAPYGAPFLATLAVPSEMNFGDGIAISAKPIEFTSEALASLRHRGFCPVYLDGNDRP